MESGKGPRGSSGAGRGSEMMTVVLVVGRVVVMTGHGSGGGGDGVDGTACLASWREQLMVMLQLFRLSGHKLSRRECCCEVLALP